MKAPFLSNETFLQDVDAARRQPDRLHIWWMGQSGFLILWQNQFLLLDPYLSESLTAKYANTDKPHVRVTAMVIQPERLNFVDVVTSSHNHTDHLDGDTLKPLFAANPDIQFVVPEANRHTISEKLGIDPGRMIGLDDGITETVGAFRFSGVPAAHEQIERDELGRHKYLGYIVEVGPFTLYHSGDTLQYPGMKETLRQWTIDVALLPINGRKPERNVAGNLDGQQAAELASDVGIKLVIPCHYDMFVFNTAQPDDFIVTCESLGQAYCVLRNGERWSSEPAGEPEPVEPWEPAVRQ